MHYKPQLPSINTHIYNLTLYHTCTSSHSTLYNHGSSPSLLPPRPRLSLRPLAATPSPASPIVVDDDLRRLCSHTSFPDMCLQSLSAKPECNSTNPKAVAGLSIRVAAEAAAAAAAFVSDHLNAAATNETRLWQCLDDCSDFLEDAVEQLDDATVAADVGALDDAHAFLTAAIADADTCDQGCGKKVEAAVTAPATEEVVQALAGATEEFRKFCKISISLTTLSLDANVKI
uniref:Pectinesterase inhibitor domain-containing protein n=1 Tax=Ananas comosus var. bracteatus TaxID=296719 RepID=A0A6V7NEN5_ANACO|nr:unnamed protein product [Ananas comosus var. bracteatus]